MKKIEYELDFTSLPKMPRGAICKKINKLGIEQIRIQNILIDGDNIVVYYWKERK